MPSVQLSDRITVIFTAQGNGRVASARGHVSSLANGSVGITLQEEAEWKVKESDLTPINLKFPPISA
jgi:hypothetical protein